MAAVNYEKLAKEVIETVGGEANIISVTHCATRLRFVLKDESKADQKATEAVEGIKGVIKGGGQYQVVVGTKVPVAFEEVTKIVGTNDSEIQMEEKKTNLFDMAIQTIAGIFTPILLVLCGSGVLKGVLALLTTLGVLAGESTTYTILYAAADSIFVFMPFALAFTAAKRFGSNQFIALALAGAMCYPSILDLYNVGTAVTFAGIPVTLQNYTGTVLPIIFAVYVDSKLEKLLKKIIPDFIYGFLMPFICLIVMVPVTLIVVGPILTVVSNGLAAGYSAIAGISPIIPGIVIGGFWQVLVVFGIHWGFAPLMMNNVATNGFDTMCPIIGPSNFSQAGAALGVFLKSKNLKVKEVAGSAALAGIFGITEPTIYGVTLKYKKPFYMASVAGIVGGIIVVMGGASAPSIVIPGLLTLPAFIGPGFAAFLIGCIVSYVGAAVLTFLFGYNDKMAE